MFSKKILVVVGALLLIAVNIAVLSVSSERIHSHGFGRFALYLVAPIQDACSRLLQASRDAWRSYFSLVAVSRENAELKAALHREIGRNSRWQEIELSNERLRRMLGFRNSLGGESVAAEVVGRDPSPWYRAVIINKGSREGLRKGLPVVVPEGIVGQVSDVTAGYAKVMLITDRNSGVDALVQRTRARGVIKGESTGRCVFQYVLRKDEVNAGDRIVASGLDGVFPKGMPVGDVSGVVKRAAGIFQEVAVTPYVDFDKIEEVLVVVSPPQEPFADTQ